MSWLQPIGRSRQIVGFPVKPAQVIPMAISQWAREKIHTFEPGIVQSDDPATKRAKVQPTLRRLWCVSGLTMRCRGTGS